MAAPSLNDIVMAFNDLTNEVIREAWFPRIYDVSLRPQRSWFQRRIKRDSSVIDSMKMKIAFMSRLPWAWRGISPHGYTPTGTKFEVANQEFELASAASAAAVTEHMLRATKMRASEMTDLANAQMGMIEKTFPYFMRCQWWSSQGGKKAIGKVASNSTTEVTLSGTGMWFSETKDRAKLFERGMVIQVYDSSGDKRSTPITVTDVDLTDGKVTFDRDPGFEANDILVPSDIGGLDTPYMENFAGLLDVIDDDNTFQGVNRALAANSMFRAYTEDASSADPDYSLISKFLDKVYNPPEAIAHKDLVRKYFMDNLQANVRFTPGGTFEDGFQYIEVDNTRIYAEWDCPRDQLLVPDYENMKLADMGAVENLNGEGWVRVAGRTIYEYIVIWYGAPYAIDCRKMGRLYDIGT